MKNLTVMNEKQVSAPSQNRYFLLYELFQTISSTLDHRKALDLIIDAAVRLTGANSGSLCLVDWSKGVLDIEVSRGFVQPLRDLKLKVGEGITGWVAKTGEALLVHDTSKDPRYVEVKQDIRSELAVPLTIDGKLIGVLNVDSVQVNAFNVEDLELLTLLSKQSALMIQNARLYEKMVMLEEQTRRAERMAAVGELAAGVAHEIRNPLTIIKMIFESGDALNEKDVEIIMEELERMRKNITHFLKFAKPSDPNREPCDVNEGLENVLFLLTRLLDEKQIVLQCAFDAKLPKIHADPIQLRQVFLNVLMNSIEALPENGVIRVNSMCHAGGWIRIQIEDNGIGMPLEVKDKLFAPFTTTKPTGLGLGLSIAKRIIKGHHGKIRIESVENRGTMVEIDLPQHDLDGEPVGD
jgi:signal transduction histidine kinase